MNQPLSAKYLLSTTITASAAIKGHRFVGYDDAHAGAGAAVLGVSTMDAAQGVDLAVGTLGEFDMIAPAPIARGDLVASDAEGRPVTTADATIACGRALKAAEVAGGIVKVLLK